MTYEGRVLEVFFYNNYFCRFLQTKLETLNLKNQFVKFQPDLIFASIISSVIRQKGESQNGCFKKAKHAKISEKQTFLTP